MKTDAPNVDQASRDRIHFDLDSNFMVEAAAGTGKTTSIVGRMVNLVAHGKCDIGRMAAVTFTHKAAAELRERFHARLQLAVEENRPEKERQRLRTAARRVERLFVGTFHAFCSMLLHERPIEAGVDPGFRGIEEQEDVTLRDDAWNAFLSDLHCRGDGRLQQVHDLGLKTVQIRSAYERFLDFPDIVEWPTERQDELDLKPVQSAVEDYLQHIESLRPEFPDDRGTDKLMNLYDAIHRQAEHSQLDRRAEFMELLAEFDTSKKATLKWWHNASIARQESERLATFRTSVVRRALDWWWEYRYRFLIGVLVDARATYDELRLACGGLNFADLLLKTASALRWQPSLRRYFQSRFTHLLVDEFQDTDPIQAEILAYLTGENVEEQRWTRCQPRPGSLFLVGDPKQSIYRFRRADIVTYAQMKRLLVESGGEVLPLSRNFRTIAEVREFGNRVFDGLFGARETKYSPAARPMEQGRVDTATGELAGVRALTIPSGRKNQDEVVAYEANAIARYIGDCLQNKRSLPRTTGQIASGKSPQVEPGDFMIITPQKRHLSTYAAALDHLGIPNSVSGRNPFLDIEELDMLLNCLRAIDDARDPIPYVALLRGNSLGFSDADLFELKRNGGRLSYTSELPEQLDQSLKNRFTAIHSRLQRYRYWLRSRPFPSAIQLLAADLGLLAKAAAAPDGNIKAGGLYKSFEWMRGASWDFDSVVDAISFLENLAATSEAEGCTVLPPPDSQVRLMNIHKAKGLEAPIVFLACPFTAKHPPRFHVDRSCDEPTGFFVISERRNWTERMIARPTGWDGLQEEEQQFIDAEKLRLLYVAATRAGSQLIVTKFDKPGHLWHPLTPYIAEYDAIRPPDHVPAMRGNAVPKQLPELSESVSDVNGKWERATRLSYETVAAKRLALGQAARPSWQVAGNFGQAWGTAIHELLEIRSRDPSVQLRRIAERLSEEQDLGLQRVPELLATVDAVFASELLQRAHASGQVYHEIPFDVPLPSEDFKATTVVKGVIDLVFRESNGWVIVDYKTDGIAESDIAAAVGYYGHQLDSYRRFWTVCTGEPVVEAGLFFTGLNRYVPAYPI